MRRCRADATAWRRRPPRPAWPAGSTTGRFRRALRRRGRESADRSADRTGRPCSRSARRRTRTAHGAPLACCQGAELGDEPRPCGDSTASTAASMSSCRSSRMKTQARSVAVPRPNSSVSQGSCGMRFGPSGSSWMLRTVQSKRFRPGPGRPRHRPAPEADVVKPGRLLHSEAVEVRELHLAEVLDLRQLGQRLGQRGRHRIELPIGRRLLCANPLVELIDDLPEHLRLRPHRQQGVDRLVGLRRSFRVQPLENLREANRRN